MLAGGLMFYQANKAPASVLDMNTDFSVSAEKLLADFEHNESEANKKYLDKVIEIEGLVIKKSISNNKTSIYIDANNDLSNVIFQLKEDNNDIREGDKIKIKGICTGYLLDVILVRAMKI